MSTGRQAEPHAAAIPEECAFPRVDGPTVKSIDDFTDQAELVALVTLGDTREVPAVEMSDAVMVRLVASATVDEAIKGAKAGETFEFFHSVKTTNPEYPERPAHVQGPEGYEPKSGDRMIVAMAPTNSDGERELTSPSSFFVDRGGALDPDLQALRARCAQWETSPFLTEARDKSTADVLSLLRESAAN